jgi:hypothetical protein
MPPLLDWFTTPTIRLMPDPTADSPAPTPTPQASPETSPTLSSSAAPSGPITDFNIGEEFGTAKRNLPPARIVLVSILVIAVIVAVVAFLRRPKPLGGGAIDFVSAAEVPNQNMVLTAITLTLRNTADKSLWVRSLKAELTTSDGKNYEDEAASAVDLDRYFQLFPALKESAEAPLPPETKLQGGTDRKGTIVVSFPVTKQAFDQRKSLTVTVQPYDQPLPIVLR